MPPPYDYCFIFFARKQGGSVKAFKSIFTGFVLVAIPIFSYVLYSHYLFGFFPNFQSLHLLVQIITMMFLGWVFLLILSLGLYRLYKYLQRRDKPRIPFLLQVYLVLVINATLYFWSIDMDWMDIVNSFLTITVVYWSFLILARWISEKDKEKET